MKNVFFDALYALRSGINSLVPLTEVAILAYHSVSDDLSDTAVSIPEFESHLAALTQNGYSFVTLERAVEWYEGTAPGLTKAVALTFDDGYADFKTSVLPMLEKYTAPAVVFVVGDRQTYGARNGGTLQMLSQADLDVISRHPLVEVGYHTLSHPDIRSLGFEKLREEVEPPFPCRYFAYPGGNYSDEAKKAVASCGYAAAFSIKAELLHPGQDRWILPRSVITRRMTSFDVLKRASMASTWYRSARRFIKYG